LNITDALQRNAIDCQMAFANMRPIIRRANMVTINAELASAKIGQQGLSMGVIAREMMAMIANLQTLIEEAEGQFTDITRNTAQWLKVARNMKLFERALSHLEHVEAGQHPTAETSGDRNRMEKVITEGLGELAQNQNRFFKLIRQINKLVERITWVAVRQSHFTAITAKVEAAKLNGNGGDIRSVANEIQELAAAIHEVEQMARHQISSVVREAGIKN